MALALAAPPRLLMTHGHLRDKVALITGSGSGIGRATARRVGREGAAVIVADIAFDAAREANDDVSHLSHYFAAYRSGRFTASGVKRG